MGGSVFFDGSFLALYKSIFKKETSRADQLIQKIISASLLKEPLQIETSVKHGKVKKNNQLNSLHIPILIGSAVFVVVAIFIYYKKKIPIQDDEKICWDYEDGRTCCKSYETTECSEPKKNWPTTVFSVQKIQSADLNQTMSLQEECNNLCSNWRSESDQMKYSKSLGSQINKCSSLFGLSFCN